MRAQSNAPLPRFAVCLAAYNGTAYIDEQIGSILAQRGVLVQIFISVDRSTDDTESHVAAMAAREPRLTLLPCGERFGGAGPNFYRLLRDVDTRQFDYVSLADQDDIWHPEKLLRAHRLMAASGAVGYSSNVTAFWQSGRTELVDKAQPQTKWDFKFEACGPGCTYVLHTSLALPLQQLVRQAGAAISHVGYHDWLIYAYAREHDKPWIIDDWSSMQYRQHANNQLGVNSGLKSYWMRMRHMLNGYFFEQSLLISDLIGARPTTLVDKGLRGGRLGYVWLAMRASQCRRRRLDQLWFFSLCILISMTDWAGKVRS